MLVPVCSHVAARNNWPQLLFELTPAILIACTDTELTCKPLFCIVCVWLFAAAYVYMCMCTPLVFVCMPLVYMIVCLFLHCRSCVCVYVHTSCVCVHAARLYDCMFVSPLPLMCMYVCAYRSSEYLYVQTACVYVCMCTVFHFVYRNLP